MPENPQFAFGDRVMVADDCPDNHLTGATGVVVPFPEYFTEGPTAEGTYWVEFDEPVPFPNSPDWCPASEIDGEHLRRI